MIHTPVLKKQVLEFLHPEKGHNFIDCNVGFAGHSSVILEKIAPSGKVLGIDLDQQTLDKIEKRKNLILAQGNFADLKQIQKQNNFYPVHGILFDLGFSSWQIDESSRGFSFQKDEPLLMNYQDQELTAQKIINDWPEQEISKILWEYGQERFSRRIARKIVQHRQKEKIETTFQLVKIIQQVVPLNYKKRRIHSATKTFQALRIAVNDELNNLIKALPQALEILEPHSRLIVISFHSLEDRIVKVFFKEQAQKNKLKILTKKPINPEAEEIKLNPRSRSAKLRAAQKI